MIRTGKVIQAEGNALEVCFSRMETCEACGMCGSGRADSVIKIKGTAHRGDMVDVEMPDAKVLKASALTYLVPLTGLILGLILGTEIFPAEEVKVLMMGFAGMATGLVILKLVDRKLGHSEKWQPHIVAVYPIDASNPKTIPKNQKT